MGRVYITPVKGRYILSRNRTVIVWDGLKLDDMFWVFNCDQQEIWVRKKEKRLHEKANNANRVYKKEMESFSQ